jgi:hypothetical protein
MGCGRGMGRGHRCCVPTQELEQDGTQGRGTVRCDAGGGAASGRRSAGMRWEAGGAWDAMLAGRGMCI